MSDRLGIGVQPLDRKLGGGLPTGSVVALTASPSSQSELLLSRLLAGHETAYLSTERTASAIRSALRARGVDLDALTIYDVGRETPVIDALQFVRERVDQELLIVDPVNRLEGGDEDQYREFLTALGRQVANTDATALLYGLSGPTIPEGRTLTTYMADVVVELETTVEDGTVENQLTVPKFRGGRAFEESMRLELTERVKVDTSRDIA